MKMPQKANMEDVKPKKARPNTSQREPTGIPIPILETKQWIQQPKAIKMPRTAPIYITVTLVFVLTNLAATFIEPIAVEPISIQSTALLVDCSFVAVGYC